MKKRSREVGPCRNCGRVKQYSGRRLCYTCWNLPTIRCRYEPQRKPRKLLPCVHCRVKKGTCPRGLCKVCYWTPEIRAATPLKGYFGNARGSSQDFCGTAAPCEPTEAGPGTAEVKEVYAERVRLRQEMFHSRDGWIQRKERLA